LSLNVKFSARCLPERRLGNAPDIRRPAEQNCQAESEDYVSSTGTDEVLVVEAQNVRPAPASLLPANQSRLSALGLMEKHNPIRYSRLARHASFTPKATMFNPWCVAICTIRPVTGDTMDSFEDERFVRRSAAGGRGRQTFFYADGYLCNLAATAVPLQCRGVASLRSALLLLIRNINPSMNKMKFTAIVLIVLGYLFVYDFGRSKPANSTVTSKIKYIWPDVKHFVDTHAIIHAAATKHNVPAAFVKSIVAAESNFNPNAISPKGAVGLMQLMPSTALEYGADPTVPEQNVDAGTRYLGRLLKRYSKYRNGMSRAIAAYNAGPTAVDRYRGVPPYRETRRYVIRVLSYMRQFEKNRA
jgi:hypothetical protein